MPPNGHSKLWLPAGAVLIVVALACAYLWFRKSGARPATDMATRSSSTESSLPDKAAPIQAPAGSPKQRTVADALKPTGPSTLRIHVVDAVTRVPVAGAKCFVEPASDEAHDFGSLETDADGRGTVSGLPAATWVVHALRKPPHASGYAAIELNAGESREVELRLTAGGTLVGRAVDDATQPVADAEVSVASERNDLMGFGAVENWDVVTRTGPDGSFEIQDLVSRPVRVSIVEGEMRAQIWASVSVRVQSGLAQGYAHDTVADGARVDLGDVVLPRGRTFTGHVLDARRAPVEGALVDLAQYYERPNSSSHGPRVSPASAKLDASKVLTAADGSFRVQSVPTFEYASVTTKDGFFEQFKLPDSNPPPADLELVLEDWSTLEIELVDEADARITASAPVLRGRKVTFISADRRSAGDAGRMDARLVFHGKRQVHAEVVADADGLFRIQTAGTSGESRRLHFELPGYLPIDEDIGVQTALVERRRFTLHLLPTMRVHVSVAAQPSATHPGSTLTLYIQACLLDPTQYANPMNMPGRRPVHFPGEKCCGQGSLWTSNLEAGEQVIELPVLAQGNYWLHAEVPSTRKNEQGESEAWLAFEEHIGPFPADGATHELKVPSVERPPLQEDHRGPQPASAPGKTSVTGRIIDAVTQKGIDYASISMVPVPTPADPLGNYAYSAGHDGHLSDKVLRPGRYSMRMYARKYRVPTLEDVTIADGKTLDLGTIALAPLPVTVLSLVEADGPRAARGTHVDMRSGPGFTALVQASVERDDGTIELQEDLASGTKIRVREERQESDIGNLTGVQWLMHDFRPDEAKVELRLRKWQPIEVRVSGAIQELPGATVWCFVDEVGASSNWIWSNRLTEVLAAPDGTRNFRGEVGGPGHLQVSVACTLLQPFSQSVDIQDQADVQTFLLTPIR